MIHVTRPSGFVNWHLSGEKETSIFMRGSSSASMKKGRSLSSHKDWELAQSYLPEYLHLKERGSQVLKETVLGGRFISQRAEKRI